MRVFRQPRHGNHLLHHRLPVKHPLANPVADLQLPPLPSALPADSFSSPVKWSGITVMGPP